MTDKPKTRAQLEAIIAELKSDLTVRQEALDARRRALDEAIASEKKTRAQFDDLKQRLATAEAHNQRMRGYIDRVQEDDVVREDLVATGDPAGEQRLVPKRKPTMFCEPVPYGFTHGAGTNGSSGFAEAGYVARNQPAPKHWVTY